MDKLDRLCMLDETRLVAEDTLKNNTLTQSYQGMDADSLVKSLCAWLMYFKGVAEGRDEQELVEQISANEQIKLRDTPDGVR